MHPGEAAGLGVELNEELAAKYPYERAYLPVNRKLDGSMHNRQSTPNYAGPTSFTWQGQLGDQSGSGDFGRQRPYWISQPISISSSGNSIDPTTGLPITPYYNISISPDTAAYTNGSSLYLQSGAHNLFGLAFQAALVNAGSMATLCREAPSPQPM